MARHDPASSILEFLTHPNPKVFHLTPGSLSNTHGIDFYWPKETQKWAQFEDLGILRSAFRGRLFQAAIRTPSTPLRYPYYNEKIDCSIREEKKTKTLIDKWNHSIVTQALEEVDEFRPSYWANDGPISGLDKSHLPLSPDSGEETLLTSSPTRRRQPPRECNARAKKRRKPSRHRRVPDAGTIILSEDSNEATNTSPQERFPKEYKPAGKWSSDKSIEQGLLSTSRAALRWKKSHSIKGQAWPIRQAFTYCIDNMCRYGCILTCQEAFIFRIQPLEQEPDTIQSPAQLQQALVDKGKMEYVAIPWENHNQGEARDTRVWTVNLAMWFIHVLAGHRYEAAWRYDLREHESLGDFLPSESWAQVEHEGSGRLDEEEIAFVVAVRDGSGNEDDNGESTNDEQEESESQSESTEADNTQRSQGNPVTPSKKRKRESELADSNDPIHFSFSEHRA